MIRLLSILLLSGVALTAAPKLEIKRVYQKVVEATGEPYGSPGGIYFKYTGLDPFIMYGLEYSYDMKKWTCLLYTSPSPRDGLLSRMPSSA